LYFFYNYYPKATEKKHWHCRKGYNQKLLGWTLSTVKNVETALATHGCRNFNYIHSKKDTIPTKCLFDCPILIKKYQDKSLIGEGIKLFGSEAKKLKSIPSFLIDKRDIIGIDMFPEELYDKQIEIYPKRIAIFDLGPGSSNDI